MSILSRHPVAASAGSVRVIRRNFHGDGLKNSGAHETSVLLTGIFPDHRFGNTRRLVYQSKTIWYVFRKSGTETRAGTWPRSLMPCFQPTGKVQIPCDRPAGSILPRGFYIPSTLNPGLRCNQEATSHWGQCHNYFLSRPNLHALFPPAKQTGPGDDHDPGD